MKSKWRLRVWIFVAASLVAVFAFVALIFVPGRYHYDDPTYRYVLQRLSAGRPTTLEPDKINKGDWQFLCLIGAYNDPVAIIQAEAARRKLPVKSVDSVPTQLFGISPVEEDEGAVSFLDGAGRGRTALIDGVERIAGQHGYRCFGRGDGGIVLPVQ